MKITLEISDAEEAQRIVDGVCGYYQYQEQITNFDTGELEDNQQTKEEFVEERLVQFLKEATVANEKTEAQEAAVIGLKQEVDDIAIT